MTTTTKMLEAACEIAGGPAAFAQRLGISETLLNAFMNDGRPLPDPLLLKAVDIILEDRQSRMRLEPGAGAGLRTRTAHSEP